MSGWDIFSILAGGGIKNASQLKEGEEDAQRRFNESIQEGNQGMDFQTSPDLPKVQSPTGRMAELFGVSGYTQQREGPIVGKGIVQNEENFLTPPNQVTGATAKPYQQIMMNYLDYLRQRGGY